jgi:transcriptional regulator with XRE-family HTH domain
MNLEFYRNDKNWTQERLEAESGVSQGYISALERGTKQPTIPIVKKLAAALGITMAELLGDTLATKM